MAFGLQLCDSFERKERQEMSAPSAESKHMSRHEKGAEASRK